MSRWSRGRGGSVAVPLDSALFRENTNCPSAARSAGTVGKWGITSFTSIRSAPYAYSSNAVKKPIQDQNNPLTVPAVETEQPPPRPKKFFKSRNAEAYPPVPQITYAPPISNVPMSPEHSTHTREKKSTKRSRAYTRDSSSPELPRRNSEKTKAKKSSVATKASKKEEAPTENTQPPNKRYLVRNRDKVINYAEDGSNSPIPEFTRYESSLPKITSITSPKEPALKVPSPKISPLVASPTVVNSHEKVEIASPSTSKDKDIAEERKPPPIVLRISKGTSRIVSTDSNEGFTSPGSDRHSSMDTHSDIGFDHKKSPSMESICSPKHEGLKITIKCAGLTQESKKEKKKDKKEHKSHKRHHRYNSDDEPLKKPSKSPLPGSGAYDLYKTLATSPRENGKNSKKKVIPADEIESQLANLESTGSVIKSTRLEVQQNEPLPEPKPPENSGRSRRNRPNVNYSENDDYLDVITSNFAGKHGTKTVSDIKKETRKTRKKSEFQGDEDHTVTSPKPESSAIKSEQAIDKNDFPKSEEIIEKDETSESDKSKLEQSVVNNELSLENSDLINILSGGSESGKSETHKIKLHRKHKHKHNKNSSPEHDIVQLKIIEPIPPEENIAEGSSSKEKLDEEAVSDVVQELSNDTQNTQTNSQSSDSAYNSCPNENLEEDSQKTLQANEFKSPMVCDNEIADDQIPMSEKPSVKLVITKKKGSIFKSKSLVNDNPSPLPARKRRHLYKHEWDKGNETPRPEPPENTGTDNQVGEVSETLQRVTRYRSPDPVVLDKKSTESVRPYTSVRCPKESKEFYTVVRNVKKAHQIQEIGEFQEFNDDVEYLLDALQNNNPISTRCLSAITLASKCTAPAFRMHLRAHGTVQKFFSALHDATNDQSLGLCTATVMFVLSQDRLNMDLDRESLELMLNLLESDVSHKNALDDCGLTSAQLTKTQERVRELCAEIKSQGKAQHLDLENITVGHLAMETLLSLTSKRAGEWFKEELRVLGGVDHIVRTIQDCAATLDSPVESWSTTDMEVLRKADRCLRVLENVTQQNEDNQLYLCGGGGGAARTICGVLRAWCGAARTTRGNMRQALLDAALPALKVLLNLSHSFNNTTSLGAQVIGEQLSVMETCLIILNNQANFITDARNFEFSVCVLLLLVNLVQNNETNTQRLLNVRIRIDNEDDIISRSVTALDLIVDLFYKREDLARRAEENTDALLDGKPDENSEKKSQDDIDETVAKLLARAGSHMEHSMVGAYMALLLGHVGKARATIVRARVPRYAPLLPTLRKYYAFLALTASAEAAIVAHVKATQRIIEFMEASDAEQDAAYSNPSDDLPQDMSLNNMTNNYSYSSSDRSMELDGYH